MRRSCLLLFSVLVSALTAPGQNTYPYFLRNAAGCFPLGDGGPAVSALLYSPHAAVADSAGNLFILDSRNFRVRKVTPAGTISTLAMLNTYAWDMKLGPDGSLYVAGTAQLLKVSQGGPSVVLAGTGMSGFSGDGGPAISARIGTAYGIALDAAGNVYFSDVSSSGDRVRQITTDGVIHTIAGISAYGFNGDNQPATSAALYWPRGIAVDSAGFVYVADLGNSRVRKFKVGGQITTTIVAALPIGLAIDSNTNLYITDIYYNVLVKLTAAGALTLLAGSNSAFGAVQDGFANNSNIDGPGNVSVDAAGNLYLVESSHIVRRLTQGVLTTMAGKMHYGGDNGPATAALLNEPSDLAFDNKGNLFIADASNYLIRKVAADGTISTYGGKPQLFGKPLDGTIVGNNQLPYINAMASDSTGALYIAADTRIYKIDSAGVITTIAGGALAGDSGDRGPATAATFKMIAGLAVDPQGNLYIADSTANRVRVVAASSGIITAVAGTGSAGAAGDGGPATSATLSLSYPSPLAIDGTGNVYIADVNNLKVRRVTPAGVISTVVGNGSFGRPASGAAAGPFSRPNGLAADAAGNLYISSYDYPDIYVASGSSITRIMGDGSAPAVDGAPALSSSFYAQGLEIDANGDIYAVDVDANSVRKLVVNTPVGFAIVDGNNQTAPAGQSLPKQLRVQLTGRVAAGVSGVTVNFALTSGAATLSSTSALTDASGIAAVTLTLGPAAGPVVVTASVAGVSLPPVRFSATATAPQAVCSVPQPVVTSVASAGDFGGSATFASGTWLEVKGRNLAQNTRSWTADDFSGSNAPTSLDGVIVTLNGKRAFVNYISPSQINVQAPADSANGAQPLVVTTAACSSDPFTIEKAAVAPGLLAPSVFSVGGKQYLVATFTDGLTYVGEPGLISGVPFRAARPGDTITAYGIGFGEVVPTTPPGVVVAAANNLPNLTIAFDTTPATVTYAGLAPNAVGLYQFNFVVPDVPAGDHAIVVRVGSASVRQTVYLTVAADH